MYFRYIYYLIAILLWGASQRELCMSFKFGLEVQGIKGVHQNGFLIYFCGFKNFDCYNWIACWSQF